MLQWEDFSRMSHEEWLAGIDADLKGTRTHGDFRVDIDSDWSVTPFLSETAEDEALVHGPVTQAGVYILAENTAQANEKALRCLEAGAQGLVFDVNESTDFQALFRDIYLDMITVLLRSSGDHAIIKNKIDGYLVASGQSGSNLYLAAGENTVMLGCDEGFRSRNKALKKHLDFCIRKNIRPVVIVQLKQNFLTQIAELRSVRRIWQKQGGSSHDLAVFSMVSPGVFDPAGVHTLIVSTYLLMSAVIGMSDMASGMPYGEDFEQARLSLNVQHILQHESRMTQVTDPVAGSYLLSRLTSEMSALH